MKKTSLHSSSTGRHEKPPVPQKGKLIDQSVLTHIIRAGIQAPSGDNVQPWTFVEEENSISLFIDREADNSFFNVNQAATLISAGAVLQNMLYMAEVFGLETDVDLFPTGEGSDHIAVIRLIPAGKPDNNSMEKALWERCTNRRMYKLSPVKKDVWDLLKRTAGDQENILLLHNSEEGWRRPLARAVYLADRVRAEREDLHRYLMDVIRFKPVPRRIDKEKEIPLFLRKGMPLKNLQAGLMGELYMRSIRPWPVMRCANFLGIGRAMPVYGFLSVLYSGGIGMICVKSLSETSIVQAGCAIERIWCELENQGLAFQPLAAVPLLSLRLKLEGEKAFTSRHVNLLKKALEITGEQLNIPSGFIPLFMFRTGKSDPITQGTYRQNIEELLRCN